MIIKERITKADGTIKYRNYLRQEKLGKGGFAECFLVQRMDDKRQYALKIIPKKLLMKSKARQKMLSEIKIHRTAKHKNICQLERAFEDDDNVYMLLQLCKNRTLFELMQRRKKLTPLETQYFIYQLIDSLCYMHNKKVVHRDVKLGNLLLSDNMQLKLADFGLATSIQFTGDRKHTVCGTPNYIAPEIIKASMGIGHSGHSYEVDIWSTGVILYVMMVGKAPFETSKIQRTYERIARGEFTFPDSFKDEGAKDLIRRILVVDPSKRYTFQQILTHPFMNPKSGIPKELPISSYILNLLRMNSAPKLSSYEKSYQQNVKESARNASINTLRSSIDHSLSEDFDRTPDTQRRGETSRSSRDVKSLLRSVFSATSISKSIEKLSLLGKSISNSPQSRQIHPLDSSRSSNGVAHGSAKYFPSHASIHLEGKQEPVFIMEYRKEIIWSYVMSNGYVGTYESQENNYKILYNSKDKLYFEIQNDGIPKKVKADIVALNQNIINRKKFLEIFIGKLPCQAYTSSRRLVYLKRVFEVKSDNLILFKLSNNDIQTYNYETHMSLLVTGDELILMELKNGKENLRVTERKDRYTDCKNKTLISMYLKIKKILIKISNMGKE